MRNLFSILCFIAAGICICTLGMLAFMQLPGGKIIAILIFGLLSMLALWAAYSLSDSPDRKKYLGITLFLSSGFVLLQQLTFLCMDLDPEFQNMTKMNTSKIFGDYWVGIPLVLGLFILGISLARAEQDHTEADEIRQQGS